QRHRRNNLKPKYGAILGNTTSGLGERADRDKCRDIIDSHQSSKRTLLLEQLFRHPVAAFKTRISIKGVGQLNGQLGIDLQVVLPCKGRYPLPTHPAVSEFPRTT